VFIAYPNNPTGNLFDEAAMERVLRAAPGLVVVDEAYHAFAGRSYMSQVPGRSNLLVMRTLSKLGLAGLRLGLVAGSGEWLQQVDKVRLPYNVSVLTQLVAEEALQHRSLLDEQAHAIKRERLRLHQALERIPATQPFPSEANFILFRIASAGRVFNGLKERGVLVKNLDGSHPALRDCLRVTVGTPAENDRFLAALQDASTVVRA
jgi:histidinol-phosphate aminotransferase